ncbi:MAG: glycine--tRNA ligase, partial [Fidelibacterota bacterium]
GKAFRNEVTTGNFIFRSREFEQMELEYFVSQDENKKWFDYWVSERFEWYVSIGIDRENLRLRKHGEQELAHYARECYDIEYSFPFGWQELEGIADRGQYDLMRHSEFSGKKISYFDSATRKHTIPVVIESSAGVDRTMLTLLVDAYDEEDERVVLRLHPRIAPIKVAVLPLVKRDNMPEVAKRIHDDLKLHFNSFYDEGGSIGRRYRRQDEAGTPFGITVDSRTLEDQTVTLRDRDTMEQIRVSADRVVELVRRRLEEC